MKKIIDIKRLRLFLWIGFAYTMLWIIHTLVTFPERGVGQMINEIWRGIYFIFANYILFEYTIPRLSRKKIFRSVLLIAGQLLLYSYGMYFWRYIGIQLHIFHVYRTFESVHKAVENLFSTAISSAIFFGIMRHIYDHIKLRQAAQQLRIEKQEAELNYLKSQTNPHFLFNTLNNIYALARDKSDLAPQSILKLSQILRFMLYETTGDYVTVEQEVKIMEDYIALEKLRYDETLDVNFRYDILNMKQTVPPLLLMPLVENAFKHGVSETRKQPFVKIYLSIDKHHLQFLVRNSTDILPAEWRVKENIGLSNLRRQLELLFTDYELTVKQGEEEFTASLIINLASHVENKMHSNRR